LEAKAAQEMRDTGKRALVGVLAGGAWIAWGGVLGDGVGLAVSVALMVAGGILLFGSGYCIAKGMRWLKKTESLAQGRVNKGFLLVIALEAAGVGGAIAAAQKLGRLEMLPTWIGTVIGLHFLGLAKVFRVAAYYATGVGMILWCVVVWLFARGEWRGVAACLGIGVILWATAAFNLYAVLNREREPVTGFPQR
jgi:hypothetical protein